MTAARGVDMAIVVVYVVLVSVSKLIQLHHNKKKKQIRIRIKAPTTLMSLRQMSSLARSDGLRMMKSDFSQPTPTADSSVCSA